MIDGYMFSTGEDFNYLYQRLLNVQKRLKMQIILVP